MVSDPNNKGFQLFPLQSDGTLERVERDTTDALFEEALGAHESAQQPNRSFVGDVIHPRRFLVGMLSVLGVLLIFIGQTSALQIFNGEEYRALAENNRIREKILPAQRGIIYDRDGEVLASNQPTFDVITAQERLPLTEEERLQRISALADFFNKTTQELVDLLNTAETRDESVLLVDNITYEKAIQFASRQSEFPEFSLEVASQRTYITDQIPSFSHLLGYTGVVNQDEYQELRDLGYRRFDHTGKQGLEQQYEQMLRGTFGYEIQEVDALGNTERIVSKEDPIDGENLHLTIDAGLQAYTEYVLTSYMEDTEATKASVVVMDPSNGEILTMVSWPAFDANLFTSGIDQETYETLINDERLPLFPRAFAGEFPSGSTIKPTYAAAGLVEGIINAQTAFSSTGGVRVGVWFFPDWRAGGHGRTDVYHAIADSVNTFFYILGGGYEDFDGLGLERLMAYAELFGFGAPTGLDIPGEASGFLPSKEWKLEVIGEPWYIGDTYNTSIGQGYFLATPLQIAQSTAVFANGGHVVTPHLAQHLESTMTRIIPEEHAQTIKDAMRQTVTVGSARSLSALAIEVGGKTGTAQWSTTRPNHAWFTGFAPYDQPEVVITVLVEEGADDYLAVPVANDILNWWFARND